MVANLCPETRLLDQYRSGVLPEDRAKGIDLHLRHCVICRQELATLESSSQQRADEIDTVIDRNNLTIGDRDDDENITRFDCPIAANEEIGSGVISRLLAPPRRADEIGRLGHYRITGILGSGGMGVVLQGEDLRTKQQVAIKAMRPSIALNRSAIDRFLREAAATAAIDHVNVVQIHDVDTSGETPYIVMQLLRGETLQSRINREGTISLDEVLRIGRETAAGLQAAHEGGLVHRDIKPENLWLEESGRVKLLDFGLACVIDDATSLTQPGVLVGTPLYMSPEQAMGRPVNPRSDLFSLGTVLYRLVSTAAPFDRGSFSATLLAVSTSQCEPVDVACPDIPRPLAALITGLLQRDPSDRPATAAEVVRRIQAIQDDLDRRELAARSRSNSRPQMRASGRRVIATEAFVGRH